MKFNDPEIAAGVHKLIQRVNEIKAAYKERNGFTYCQSMTVEVESVGQKFARLQSVETRLDGGTSTQGVYCFVAVVAGNNKKLGSWEAGDIFKADGWASPAKHKRGNIFTDLSKLEEHGPAYL